MEIEVNNGRVISFEHWDRGVIVESLDEHGKIERRDVFDEGEIVMAVNLLRYMRDNDMKSAWLMDNDTKRYLSTLIDNGDLEEFRIFQ